MPRDFIDLVLPEGLLTIPEAVEAFNRRFVEVVESREIFDLLTGDRMSHPDFKTIFRHKQCVPSERSSKTRPATDVWLDDEAAPALLPLYLRAWRRAFRQRMRQSLARHFPITIPRGHFSLDRP